MQNTTISDLGKAFAGGAIGACTLTLIHESVRRLAPDAPRVDLLGMQAIGKTLRSVGQEPPPADELHRWALAGDLLSNSLYYSAAAIGKRENAIPRGLVLGAAAGLGAVLLPGPLGLSESPSNRTTATRIMTVAWYTMGGLAAALALRLLGSRSA
jgi:hypothetical protein